MCFSEHSAMPGWGKEQVLRFKRPVGISSVFFLGICKPEGSAFEHGCQRAPLQWARGLFSARRCHNLGFSGG